MTARIFIDGEIGTTGLQIRDRLENRADITFLRLDETERKDPDARARMLNSADIVILCLPDEAARDAVAMIENDNVRVIDASSAHRIADGWVYGMPEYDVEQADAIATARRVSNPGCYAITSVSILHPLIEAGLVPAGYPVSINAISGYSGGGKGMIADFESADGQYADTPFRIYGLTLAHKHVPEITRWGGLEHAPLFVPSVGHFCQGMIVQVPLQLWSLPGSVSAGDIHGCLSGHYAAQRFVKVKPLVETADMGGLEPEGLNGTNELHLHVFSNPETDQAVVMGLIDNLGKGASGQAVQNLNLMMGVAADTGL
ncbi:MAG TPA: N-acetyl-gamma-glutamyl-phosphate reductase [Rhodospirillales bacterium]|nr:N-acetyl-gamma-glutamyl-phosphate reductase [Rhodospirillales bacterium]